MAPNHVKKTVEVIKPGDLNQDVNSELYCTEISNN